MDWKINLTLLCSVLKAALGFNIDSGFWRSLSYPDASFGYQVVQRQSDAPFLQSQKDERGQLYRCSTTSCSHLSMGGKIPLNMSLGLAMANDPSTQNTMVDLRPRAEKETHYSSTLNYFTSVCSDLYFYVCGPTIPKDCKSITMYNGLCYEINPSNKFGTPYPSTTEECQTQADIAFLLDGSGSVNPDEFKRMKEFVKNLIKSFLGKDTQFAVIQFSTHTETHFYFNKFKKINWENEIDKIHQLSDSTNTATAIRHVVEHVFSPERGSRYNVKKILVVITDGESGEGLKNLESSVSLADGKKIVRFAIGVGKAFQNTNAKKELQTIASKPAENFVFKVNNFDALKKIQESLQAKIFGIEGSQSSGEMLKEEMSQEGFRAVYGSGYIQMSMVGANEWKGGYKKYSLDRASTVSFEPDLEANSYLGYSMAIAKTNKDPLTIIGAPRYQHKGLVMTVYNLDVVKKIRPSQLQTGEYFGVEVCAMDVNSDGTTDLILISSPMYKDHDREGRVYVCDLSHSSVLCYFDDPSQITVLRGAASERGRFGSSLAVLPDINADTFNDLAVGAPLENDGQGSIYLFQGEGGGKLNPVYSQRIAATEIQSGLKLFGISISQTSYDQSGDGLPDLAVGSKGTVVLLRSRPVVTVTTTVSFNRNPIPTQNVNCSKPLPTKANICFMMSKLSNVNEAKAQIHYTLTLDATRKIPNNRAEISKNLRKTNGSASLELNKEHCVVVDFIIKSCPDDALNPLNNELRFTFDGLPLVDKPRASLSHQVQTTTFHSIGFEISCGADKECVDDLKVDFNFTNSSVVKVGIDELLNVTVFVENRGENSYNSRITLTYPVGLSYRKFTSLEGRIECNSLDSEDGVTRGRTDCSINKPIFKSQSVAIFIISYGHQTKSELDKRIFVTANATSGNKQHSTSNELYKRKDIDVKYSIFITIDSSLSYNSFTFGENALQQTFEQNIKVTNVIRELNFTVVIKVPVKLGDKDIWMDTSSFQIKGCQRNAPDETPVFTNFVERIKENKTLNCSVASCGVFRCSKFMERNSDITYSISSNISSRWIEQIGLSSAKFLLASEASLEYDETQHIFFSTTSDNIPPVHKIEAVVEVFPKPDFTKEIIGGSLGGLAFLVLLSAGLYKAGFFKSKYNEMINENRGEEAGSGPEGDAPTE